MCPNCGLTLDPATGSTFVDRGRPSFVLLAGGDKSAQSADIRMALQLVKEPWGQTVKRKSVKTTKWDVADIYALARK